MKLKTFFLNNIRQVFKITFLEKILVNLTDGKEYGTFFTLLPPNHYQYKSPTIREVTRRKVKYHLDLSDAVDWFIYFGFKEQSREKLLALLKDGDIVLDIGANIGDVSLQSSRIVGDKGVIYSFEPDPINLNRFKLNEKLNQFKNIKLFNFGLGNKNGKYSIVIRDNSNRGMNFLTESLNNNEQYCEIKILDEFVLENCINKIDLIKIDVEGFEMKVLEGAAKTIEGFKPKLFIEIDNQNLIKQGSSAKDVMKFLEKYNYNIFHAETNEMYNSMMDFENCHFDIVGLPK